jgi:hypothetical protein
VSTGKCCALARGSAKFFQHTMTTSSKQEFQIPNPKIQTNSKLKIPNQEWEPLARTAPLAFGFWNLFGFLDLDFGF